MNWKSGQVCLRSVCLKNREEYLLHLSGGSVMGNKEAKKYRNYIIFSTVALIISIVLIIYFHESDPNKMYAFILFAALDLMELIKDIGKYRDTK